MGTYGERKVSVVLKEDCDGASEIPKLERADIMSSYQNDALVWVIEACN